MRHTDSPAALLARSLPRGPAASRGAPDILRLIESLAEQHDLTLSEAADLIADWEAGLLESRPAA